VLTALVAALAAVLGSGTMLATPAQAVDSTPSCESGVFSGAGDKEATKELLSITDNGDGTYTFEYKVTVQREAGTYRLRDCVFIDEGDNNAYDGEPLVGNTDEKDVIFTSNGNGTSSGTTTITIEAEPTDTVCDRAAVSGTTTAGVGFTDKSNVLCVPIENPPVIPEASLTVLLPLTGLLVGLGFVLWRRRSPHVPMAA
jgi:hypothetical protein